MINKFSNSFINIFISPVYIIRSRLYHSIGIIAPSFHGSILDIGCGSKPYEILFKNSTKYIGLDIEVSGHDHLNSKVDIYYDGITLPFDDASFDNVVCFEVLEHVFNFNELVVEIHRILRPGGKLLITVPFAFPEHEIPFDFFRYTSFGLNKLLQSNNFHITDFVKTTSFFLTIIQLIIIYINQFFSSISLKIFTQLVIIFPLSLIGLLLDIILPNNKNFYSNIIITCCKR
jgi:SAM-dependent methyltransferase